MAASPSRQQVVDLLAGTLARKGPAMVAEMEKRAAAGQGLEVRGITVDPAMLREALARHAGACGDCGSPGGGSPDAKSGKAASPAGQSPSGTAGAARWMPSAPSTSMLAARALSECEHAEAYSRAVKAVGGAKVGILKKPDVLGEPTGDYLGDGEAVEVVARYLCQKDGRVYLRLKEKSGWVCTRSRKNMTKVVLAALGGHGALEPGKYAEPIASTAFNVLPVLDAETMTIVSAPAVSTLSSPNSTSASSHAVACPASDGVAEMEIAGAEEEDEGLDEDMGEGEEGEEEPLDGDDEEDELDAEEVLDGEVAGASRGGDQCGSPVKAPSSVAAGAPPPSPQPVAVRRERRFRVIGARCPVLGNPSAAQLQGGVVLRTLKHKQEFISDAALHLPAEGRVYLRLKNGRGWVCEQSKSDVHRVVLAPAVRRKTPITKKMAKVIAFRGGDTSGVTKLKKEDLVRNKGGKIVSKKMSEAAKKRYADSIGKWSAAVKRAREDLGVEGFVAVKKGTAVYDKAMLYYKGGNPGDVAPTAQESSA